MPLSPQQRRPALTAGNLYLANADQNLTEVDARLTGVDKTCHRQPRRIPNNPEQIRTNLNAAEHPDQIGTPSESPPNTPKKENLNTIAAHPPSFLRRQEPTRAQRRPHASLPNSSLPPSETFAQLWVIGDSCGERGG